MKHITTAKATGVEVENDNLENSSLGLETSRVAVGVIATFAILIGIWGAACLIGGIVGSESLLDLGKSWLSAITGH